jgi:hypothetical protein
MIKKRIIIIIIGISLIATYPGIVDGETLIFDFDERQWIVGNERTGNNRSIIEYILKGETIDEWTELVTVNTIYTPMGKEIKMSPRQILMKSTIDRLRAQHPTLKWNIIEESEKSILYEWTIASESTIIEGKSFDYDEHEIARIMIGKDIHFFHYATKDVPILPDVRQKWLRIISSASLVPDGSQ